MVYADFCADPGDGGGMLTAMVEPRAGCMPAPAATPSGQSAHSIGCIGRLGSTEEQEHEGEQTC